MKEIGLGLRLAVTGGRNARLRAGLTSAGVALGMIVLLTAASVPTMIHAIDARQAARDPTPPTARLARGPDTLLIAEAGTIFREQSIRGRRLQPEGPRAPVPAGLTRLPRPGELAVSPALRDLLAHAPLLRERLHGRVVATIGDAGLTGPRELAFYTGARGLRPADGERINAFGYPVSRDPLPGFLVLILAVGVVVLLLPVGIFIATAVRFGSDARDRRLAALRLVGADRRMAVRIAAGEALFGALGGMALGALGFLAVRPLAERVSLQDVSVFATDIRPNALLTVLILALVPAAALVASIVALRRVVLEPLGVSRRAADARRRLGWRLAPIIAGGALLATRSGDLIAGGGQTSVTPIAIGVGLVLTGMVVLLPWLVDAAVRRMRGGDVAWQLAVRRLQVDGGTAARAVAGVAVAVAGAIALQTVLADGRRMSTSRTEFPIRYDARAGVQTTDASLPQTLAALRGTPGVTRATAVATDPRSQVILQVGDCAALREYGRIGRCANGDVFLTSAKIRRGRRLGRFRVPATARRVTARPSPEGYLDAATVLVTPAAARGIRVLSVDAFVDLHGRDAIERVRNTMARLSASSSASPVAFRTELSAYRTVQRGIYAGASLVLLLIAASLLIGGLEQLRERRPVIAALSAFGVPRAVLARSVLWQAAVPVVLGLAVSVAVGLALGALLLRIGDRDFSADWAAVAAMTGAGGLVIAIVSVATLPVLGRLMRPEGLRSE